MDKATSTAKPVVTFFLLEGDNVLFRGLDIGKEWEGYACPMFEQWMAKSVANYISTPNKRIFFNPGAKTYMLAKKGDENQYLLMAYHYNDTIYYDFGGTAKWKKVAPKKNCDHKKQEEEKS